MSAKFTQDCNFQHTFSELFGIFQRAVGGKEVEVQEEVGVARQWMWGAWNVGKEGEFTIPNLTDNALAVMCKATFYGNTSTSQIHCKCNCRE